MSIEAIQNHIVFQFLDEINNKGMFEKASTESGIVLLKSNDDSAGSDRWGKIVSLGPECCDELRTPGCEILIESLKWTAGVEFNGEKVWRTDESHVIAYRWDDGSDTATFGD